MSLSRNQEETNYWPSISDMFLVFFVLALAVASAKVLETQHGRKYVLDDVVAETIILATLANDTDGFGAGLGSRHSIEVPAPKETDKDYSDAEMDTLTRSLREICWCLHHGDIEQKVSGPSLRQYEDMFPKYPELQTEWGQTLRDLPQEQDNEHYATWVALISGRLGLQIVEGREDKQLRLINKTLQENKHVKALRASHGGGDGGPVIKNLDDVIEALAKEHYQIDDIPDILSRLQSLTRENEHFRREKAELERQIALLRKNANDPRLIEELQKKINELQHQIREHEKQLATIIHKLRQAGYTIKPGSDLVSVITQVLAQQQKIISDAVEIRVTEKMKELRISTVLMKESDVSFKPSAWVPNIRNRNQYNALISELSAPLLKAVRDKTLTPAAQIVEIVGHTDNTGWEDKQRGSNDWHLAYNYNLNASLGLRRAEAFIGEVVTSLRAAGVPAQWIETPADIKNGNSKPGALLKFRAYSASFTQPRSTPAESRRLEVTIRPEKTYTPSTTSK